MNRRQASLFTVFIPILMLAVVLRFSALDSRPLWFDEGVSLTLGQMPLPDVVRYSTLWQDTNPPVYRVTLGVWTNLTGITVFTARAFSALLGVLAIPLAHRIGRMLRLPQATCALAGLLLALWPMQIYYSREAKHYTFVQVFVLLAIWAWLRLFPVTRSRRLVSPRKQVLLAGAAALSTTLAVGAHYMALLAIAMLGVWTLVWITVHLKQRPLRDVLRPTLLWAGFEGAAGLALLPWVLATAAAAAAGSRSAAENVGLVSQLPGQYFLDAFLEFSAGPVGSPQLRAAAAILIFGLMVAAGWNRGFRTWEQGGILVSILFLPVLLGLGAQIAVPFFYPRFLMFVTPALALIVARGIQSIAAASRQHKQIAALALGIAVFTILANLLVSAQYDLPAPSPDLRPVATDLNRQLDMNDALIYSYSWQPGMLAAYLPGPRQPVYYPSFFEPGMAGSALDSILDEHGRVWLLTYEIGADNPINDVGLYLLEHAATPGGTWYGESQLTLFLSPRYAANDQGAESCSALDGKRIMLCAGPIDAHLAPGELLVIRLNWQASQPLEQRYVVFVHLLPKGNPIPAAQQDVQPVNGLHPSYTWAAGEWVEDLHAVVVPAQTDTYQVYAGLYDADTLERLPVDGGSDSVHLGQVVVTQP